MNSLQFSLSKSDLLTGLNQVGRLASGRMPLPILNNILIKGEGAHLILSVTDLEIGIETKIPATIEQAGDFTVSARLLSEFVQNLQDKQLTGEVIDNTTLVLKTDHSEVKIRGLDSSEFPGLPFTDSPSSFTIKAEALKEAITLTAYASALDDTRPVLAGILVTLKDKELILAATDSYRLAEKRVKLEKAVDGNCSAIVPRRTLQEVARLIAQEPGDISVFVGENQIQYQFGLSRVVSRLIEGNYPDYHAIVPNEYRTRLTAHRQDLEAALKTSQLFAREAGNLVTLAAVPGKGLTVQSVANQRGEAVHQVTAITEGDEVTITFNVKFLLEALTAIASDNLFLEFNGSERPVLIRPANSKEYLALVMPLRV